MRAIVIDTETTGIKSWDDILQVSIIDFEGNVLFNKYMKPVKVTEWPQAEAIHGISPEMVKDCENILYYKEEIQSIVDEADLIIGYNNSFDMGILADKGIIAKGKEQVDVMQIFAEIYGDWNEYHQSYRWQKLTKCADYYGYEWEEDAHNALGDVKATLYCYKKILEKRRNLMASLTIRDIEDSITAMEGHIKVQCWNGDDADVLYEGEGLFDIKDEIKDREICYIFPYDTGERPAICIELSCENESEDMR